jgi:hypothetical protein
MISAVCQAIAEQRKAASMRGLGGVAGRIEQQSVTLEAGRRRDVSAFLLTRSVDDQRGFGAEFSLTHTCRT